MTRFIFTEKPSENPEFPLFSFDIYVTLHKALNRFPELATVPIHVWIQRKQKPLACISIDDDKHDIFLHSVLNHPDTPEQVIEYILIHELIHTRVPSREVNGIMKIHPPEFFEEEKRLVPERELYWAWIYIHLNGCIYPDKKHEGTIVKRNWKKSISGHRLSLEEFKRTFCIEHVLPTKQLLL